LLAISELTQNDTGILFYLIDYGKHCILYTAVHTNDTEFKEHVGVVNKQFWLHRINCVCVPTIKHGNILLEQGLKEIFVLMTEGVARG
jgi:hypothetical protein